jgi:RHS repeat-associated protein
MTFSPLSNEANMPIDAATSVSSTRWFNPRWYNPRIGRWMTQDPSGLASDANSYRYSGNEPTNAIDPSGLADSLKLSIASGPQELDDGQIGYRFIVRADGAASNSIVAQVNRIVTVKNYKDGRFVVLKQKVGIDYLQTGDSEKMFRFTLSRPKAEHPQTADAPGNTLFDTQQLDPVKSTEKDGKELCYYYVLVYHSWYYVTTPVADKDKDTAEKYGVKSLIVNGKESTANMDTHGSGEKRAGTATAGDFLGAYAYEYIWKDSIDPTKLAEEAIILHGDSFAKKTYGKADIEDMGKDIFSFKNEILNNAATFGEGIPPTAKEEATEFGDLFGK